MRALVIGYGSIGSRHARVLRELGVDLAVVSQHAPASERSYGSIEDALAAENPQYVVVANETSLHRNALASLASERFEGTVLVEKPLFHVPLPIPPNCFRALFVGYNLRFHPLLRRLANEVAGSSVVFAEAYAGQYLPDWRPGTDFTTCYSADTARGGGVLRDLSHELDYLSWLFGTWHGVASRGGKFSALPIQSADVFSILLQMERCPVVAVQLNYVDRIGRREITIVTDDDVIRADFKSGRFSTCRSEERFEISRDDTYRLQHEAILFHGGANACGAEEAIGVLKLIDSIERADREAVWINE